jgi:predicted helicase
MPFGTGAGPATWSSKLLPDYHSFSGRGGYAFPLYDHRAGHGPLNLSPAAIDGLSLAYHVPITPEATFDAILGLLSASSYTLRFAEDLEDAFPHVPFPASSDLFEQAAQIGAAIREVETFARSPDPSLLPKALARLDTTPTGPLAASDMEDGELRLCADGSGLVTGIPKRVWDFAVSGYRVLPRWLAAREGVEIDDAFRKEFVDIVGRITELIHRFDEADLVLDATLNHTLTRDDLGL